MVTHEDLIKTKWGNWGYDFKIENKIINIYDSRKVRVITLYRTNVTNDIEVFMNVNQFNAELMELFIYTYEYAKENLL